MGIKLLFTIGILAITGTVYGMPESKLNSVVSRDKLISEAVDNAMQANNELNKTYWQQQKMIPSVQNKLYNLSMWYFSGLKKKIPCLKLKDSDFVGSLSNYNYTTSSDADIHLIIDTSKCQCSKAFLKEYFQTKSKLSRATLNAEILSTKLQISIVPDKDRVTGGVYSILHQKWVKKPTKQNYKYTKDELIKKVTFYDRKIKGLQEEYNKNPVSFECEKTESLRKTLQDNRTKGLSRDGFASIDNNIYRVLRSIGDINTLKTITRECDINKI
ncbi:MAG: hypothetical protein P1U74_04305 [Legionellaceae bacterium]|nr:hypothetical protein [Legionellaceae bacterium]